MCVLPQSLTHSTQVGQTPASQVLPGPGLLIAGINNTCLPLPSDSPLPPACLALLDTLQHQTLAAANSLIGCVQNSTAELCFIHVHMEFFRTSFVQYLLLPCGAGFKVLSIQLHVHFFVCFMCCIHEYSLWLLDEASNEFVVVHSLGPESKAILPIGSSVQVPESASGFTQGSPSASAGAQLTSVAAMVSTKVCSYMYASKSSMVCRMPCKPTPALG